MHVSVGAGSRDHPHPQWKCAAVRRHEAAVHSEWHPHACKNIVCFAGAGTTGKSHGQNYYAISLQAAFWKRCMHFFFSSGNTGTVAHSNEWAAMPVQTQAANMRRCESRHTVATLGHTPYMNYKPFYEVVLYFIAGKADNIVWGFSSMCRKLQEHWISTRINWCFLYFCRKSTWLEERKWMQQLHLGTDKLQYITCLFLGLDLLYCYVYTER